MSLYLRTKHLKPNFIVNTLRFSSTVTDITDQNEQVIINDVDEDMIAKEAEIEKKRNISRLAPAHFNIINDRVPYETPKCFAHLTVKYNRKLYGKYGSASGINPSLCWPTKKDIQEIIEYESVAYPFTIKEMMDKVKQKKEEDRLRMQKRDQEVAQKFSKLEQWKTELLNRIAKKESEATAAKEKKERLVEEVRRHFGFTLDPRDERFKEMLAKREKEQKKMEKMARREAKDKIMIAKIQEETSNVNSTT